MDTVWAEPADVREDEARVNGGLSVGRAVVESIAMGIYLEAVGKQNADNIDKIRLDADARDNPDEEAGSVSEPPGYHLSFWQVDSTDPNTGYVVRHTDSQGFEDWYEVTGPEMGSLMKAVADIVGEEDEEPCVEEHLYGGDSISVILHGGHGGGYRCIVDTHDGKHRFEGEVEHGSRDDAMRDVIAFLAQSAKFD